jgi:hypothetical protein
MAPPGRDRDGRSETGYGGGTLDDPFYEFYQPPKRTQYDYSGNPIGSSTNPLGDTGGGGGGGGLSSGDDGTVPAPAPAPAPAGGLGTLGEITYLAGLISRILSGTSTGLANGRIQSSLLNQAQARAAADIYNTQMRAALVGPRMAAEDAARGDVQANIQPFKFTGDTTMVGKIPVPNSTGGPGPQNLGPNARAAGQALSGQALGRVTSPSFNLPAPPVLPPLDTAGTGTSILNGAAASSGILAAILGLLGHNSPSNQTSLGGLPRTTDSSNPFDDNYTGNTLT